MAECDWAILCDYAFQDINRKMCIIGVFDRIFAANVPSAQNQAALAMKFVGSAGEQTTFKIEIVRPAGGKLLEFDGNVQLGDTGTAEFQFNIVGLPLPDFGLYNFNIFIGTELAKTVGFLVTQPLQVVPPQQPPQ